MLCKFNWDKLQLQVNTVKYLGAINSEEGIKPDPAKVNAFANMPTRTDKAAVQCLLGMVNFLATHIPSMFMITALPGALVKRDTHFQWGDEQDRTLGKLKSILSDSPVLQYFDPTVHSTIQADASQHRLGACLLQKEWPIAYTVVWRPVATSISCPEFLVINHLFFHESNPEPIKS